MEEKTVEDTRKWKDLPCSCIGRINIVKMAILSRAIYKFNALLIKIPITLHRNRENNPKIHMEARNPQITKPILSKKSKDGSITIPDIIVTKIARYWHKTDT
jgi:hypothetical protein